jgi:hypothetical protein
VDANASKVRKMSTLLCITHHPPIYCNGGSIPA